MRINTKYRGVSILPVSTGVFPKSFNERKHSIAALQKRFGRDDGDTPGGVLAVDTVLFVAYYSSAHMGIALVNRQLEKCT